MERQKIRLIASDLDGTLLNPRKRISDRNLQAITRAADQGIAFVPSTGRIFSALPEQIRNLPFLRYCITVNGGGIYDREEERTIFQAEIPEKRGQELFQFIHRYHTMYDCYQEGQGYVSAAYYEQMSQYIPEELQSMYKVTRKPVPDLESFLVGRGSLQKMQLFFQDLELRKQAIREIGEAFPDMSVTSSVYCNIEINIAEANKGNALRILCQQLGIDMAEVVAFGDGSNDVTMLQAAGVSVAMENGDAEAKNAAKYLTATNEEDGVAVFLENYVL